MTGRGRAVPSAVERASGLRFEDRWTSWLWALAVTGLAFLLRVWHLGTPKEFAFDETYYAKDAWSMLRFGYVRDYIDNANDLILTGKATDSIFKDTPSMVVHPEVGKWLIALGEKAFGMDPFGWRIAAAVIGSLMVLVMCRLVRRLTGSTLLGCVAGLLLTFDGMHLVLSRLALLDIFLAFFLTCAAACLVADRAWWRRRLAERIPDGGVDPGSFGPLRGTLVRPWLIAAGVSFGLAAGTKWTALYPLAAFGLLVWVWSAGARRSFGIRGAWWKSALTDGVAAFVQIVGVAFIVYVTTWTGWLINAQEYEQSTLSASQYTKYDGGKPWPTRDEPDASGLGEITQSLRSLASYHHDVYVFHTKFLNDSTHSYQSQPSGWLLLNRTVGISAESDIQPGEQGCAAPAGSKCLRVVTVLGTPVLWWGACLALLYAAVMWVGARDWRFGFALVGTLATWLPWLRYDDRPIFLFYASAALPFMVIAVALALGALVSAGPVGSPRRTLGVVAAGSFVVLVILNFAWFWPVWTGELLTQGEYNMRMWFRAWI